MSYLETKKRSTFYISVFKDSTVSDLQMATRYVQDVSKQTDRVIENSRMYVCQIKEWLMQK